MELGPVMAFLILALIGIKELRSRRHPEGASEHSEQPRRMAARSRGRHPSRPAGRDHLPRGFALTASFHWRYSVCGLIGSDVRPDWSPQTKRSNFR
jgi:hypothetical protein